MKHISSQGCREGGFEECYTPLMTVIFVYLRDVWVHETLPIVGTRETCVGTWETFVGKRDPIQYTVQPPNIFL